MKNFLLILSLVVGFSPAFGAVLVRAWPDNIYAFTKDPLPNEEQWFLNDYVCMRSEGQVVACGQTVRVTEKGLIINVTGSLYPLAVGNKLSLYKVDYEEYYNSGVVDLEYLEDYGAFSQFSVSAGVNLTMPLYRFRGEPEPPFHGRLPAHYLESKIRNRTTLRARAICHTHLLLTSALRRILGKSRDGSVSL